MSYRKQREILAGISILILSICLPRIANAQMFSVKKPRQENITPDFAAYAGIEPMNFKYEGNGESNAGVYSFKGPLLRLQLEVPGINFYLGTGGSATGLDNVSYFDAGIKAGFGLPLYYTHNVLLQIPLLLHSSYTRVTNEDIVATASTPQFQQGTFEGGLGLELNAKLAPEFRIMVNFVPSYGFSFSTRERDAGGSVFATEGKARLYFDHLFGTAGLSIGYNYNYRNFDIQTNALDYKATGNSFLIGITF